MLIIYFSFFLYANRFSKLYTIHLSVPAFMCVYMLNLTSDYDLL